MKIIDRVSIHNFRSIAQIKNLPLGNLTCIGGRNNTGKSNILRAISAFFTDEVEPGVKLDILRDCSTPERERKFISIEIRFSISSINFPSPLRTLATKLTDAPIIKKEYFVDKTTGSFKTRFSLNGDYADSEESRAEIVSFLSLFNFRYITSDRTPQKVLESNLEELRAELKYQLNKQRGREKKARKAESAGSPGSAESAPPAYSREESAIRTIAELSGTIFRPIQNEITQSDSNITSVLISTPSDIVDLISMAKYRITTKGGQNLSERNQGHGIQNSLLFYVLYLVDKNFHRKFGWKIATIWLVEEPETFLHYDLEKKLAAYFSDKCHTDSERFQALFTSHSDLFPQYADGHARITLESSEGKVATVCAPCNLHDFIEWLAAERVTTRVPIPSLYPGRAIVITEGHTDEVILKSILPPQIAKQSHVFSIASFLHASNGGDSLLLKFIKENTTAINARDGGPFIFVFDWERSKEQEFSSVGSKLRKSSVVFPNGNKSNPRLGPDWKGIERYLSDSTIERCSAYKNGLITKNRRGRYVFEKDDYPLIKNSLFECVSDNPVDVTFLNHYVELIAGKLAISGHAKDRTENTRS